ncbi:hypothetical protein AVEN_136908-1 [Araneus ventricosus]|uniref:Uncharacterized protein n=1 Tax=Araneus ventricosus TaxID=182803 RepID=A0A4Y2BJ53_ARAVE|nr:hypothetical protein AVEN_136908-1 [Araneus ventricosus]
MNSRNSVNSYDITTTWQTYHRISSEAVIHNHSTSQMAWWHSTLLHFLRPSTQTGRSGLLHTTRIHPLTASTIFDSLLLRFPQRDTDPKPPPPHTLTYCLSVTRIVAAKLSHLRRSL